MLLTPQTNRNPLRRERSMLALLLLLAGLLVLALWLFGGPGTARKAGPDLIACNAERIQGNHFVQNDYRFDGGEWQSREQARSGRFSLRLPQQSTPAFGFGIDLEGIQAGEVYEVTIWRYGDPQGGGRLAVQGKEPQGFYLETGEAVRTDDDGWSSLQLRFHIPFESSPSLLEVYVYSDGTLPVFFDDLQIEKVDLWEAQAFQPSQLYLEVGSRAMERLSTKRDEALRTGLLQTNNEDWVEGRILEDGAEIPVKLRLKGDWLDHLRGNKWSFRVKTKDPFAWRRLKVFSLHTPAARFHLHEWLLHQWWRQEDVLTPRYDFVELILNGESLGIYAFEEHFEKELLESQERREGPIVRLAEDGFWAGMARQLSHHGFIRPGSGHSAQAPANAPVEAFNQDDLAIDTTLAGPLRQAQRLLQQFRDGTYPPAEIFDLDRLAAYYAISDLLNAYHGVVWHNQRFYYNPINGRLEPIGFDGFGDHVPARYDFLLEGALHPQQRRTESLYGLLLQDTSFVAKYVAALERLSRDSYWEQFWQEQEEAWTARLSWVQLEFPDYQPGIEEIRKEIAFVRSHLLPFAENSLRTYAAGGDLLLVANSHSIPIRLLGAGNTAGFMSVTLDEPIYLPGQPPRKLWSRWERDSVIFPLAPIHFIDQQALVDQATPHFERVQVPRATNYLFFQVPGLDTILSTVIRRLPPPDGLATVQTFRTASEPEGFPAFHWEGQVIRIPAGRHQLDRDLIIGKDQELWIQAGAELDLLDGSAIISYGPVKAEGEEGLPILVTSSDRTGQGLQVLEADNASVLKRVIFQQLRALDRRDWRLTGAVTFYASSAELTDCLFQDMASEDALNMVRCEFRMEGCHIRRTASDGLDADFCKGVIKNSVFEDTTNDGLDFSGSIITVEQCVMQRNGDKGVSVGEESDVTVVGSEVTDAPIGLAAKDLSVLYVRDLELRNCGVGFAAFQKKSEYGPARIIVERLREENNERLYQIATGSRLQLEDRIINN